MIIDKNNIKRFRFVEKESNDEMDFRKINSNNNSIDNYLNDNDNEVKESMRLSYIQKDLNIKVTKVNSIPLS